MNSSPVRSTDTEIRSVEINAPPPPAKAEAPAAEKLRIEGLDLLRLFAALAVVAFHYAFRGAAADGLTWLSLPALAPVAKYGYLGVDCFFVISGFVIAWSAEGRTWRKFAVARAARIYPAFLVCMTATFLLTLWIGGPRYKTSFTQWAANLLVFSPAAGVSFMDGAYWSIVYELIFYAWMAAFIAAGAFPKHSRLILLAWMAASILNETVLGSHAAQKLLLTDHSGFFAAGVVLYLIRKGDRSAQAWMLLALGTLVGAFQLILGAEWLREHYKVALSNVVIVLIAFGSVGIVAAAAAVRSVGLRPGVVAAIGGLTYPLYLLHQKAGYILFNRLEGVLPAPVIATLTTALMIAAAWAVWRFAEPPFRKLIYKVFDRRAKSHSPTIRQQGPAQLVISWADGHKSVFDAGSLRLACSCGQCGKSSPATS